MAAGAPLGSAPGLLLLLGVGGTDIEGTKTFLSKPRSFPRTTGV